MTLHFNFTKGGKSRYTSTAVIGPGYDAFDEGVPLHACPHPRGSDEAGWWRYGWKWAWHDWKMHQKGRRRYGDYSAWPIDRPNARHKIQA